MKDPVVVIGIGEVGGVYARGLLRCGYPIYPATRDMSLESVARDIPSPQLVLVAVAENDIHEVLETIPAGWADRLGLLQNELLPRDWKTHGIADPTVVSVWFEKKKGQDVKVLLPSPIHGPRAKILQDALQAVDIPGRIVARDDAMLYELVRKNVYILTTNIAGLKTGGTVSQLWEKHRDFARQVAGDVIRLQEKLVDQELPRDALIDGMLEAFNGDPDHKCMGRSAPKRLIRALAQAQQANLELPTLQDIQNSL